MNYGGECCCSFSWLARCGSFSGFSAYGVVHDAHELLYVLVVLKDGRRRHAQQRYSSGAAGGSEPVLVLIYASRPPSAQHDVVKKIAATRPGTVQTWSLHYMYSIRGTTVVVTFNIQVNPLASLGRLTMVSGLEVRALTQ